MGRLPENLRALAAAMETTALDKDVVKAGLGPEYAAAGKAFRQAALSENKEERRSLEHSAEIMLCAVQGKMERQDSQTFERWNREAEIQGWVLLEKINGERGLFQHSDCGHEQEASAGEMRRGGVMCGLCGAVGKSRVLRMPVFKSLAPSVVQRWTEEAEEVGWSLLRYAGRWVGLYRHKACGHEQEARASEMRRGAVRCGGCQSIEGAWSEEARNKGWVLLEKISKARARYRHEPCGFTREADAGAMRRGVVKCEKCWKHYSSKGK